MIKNALSLLMASVFFSSVVAQDIVGKWKTIDHETGKAKSIVEIYEQGNKYYGKVIDIINPDKRHALCEECEGKDKDKPILGLVIITDMVKDEDVYEDGKVLNPDNGETYRCRLKLQDDPDTLQVRGYLAFFYKTQYWKRIK